MSLGSDCCADAELISGRVQPNDTVSVELEEMCIRDRAVAEAQSLLGEGREADAVARLAQAADGQVRAALAAVEALGARFVRAKVQTLSVRSPGGEWSPPQPAFDTEAIARCEGGEVFGSRCETRDDAETCARCERGEVFGSWCETRDDAEACAQCAVSYTHLSTWPSRG